MPRTAFGPCLTAVVALLTSAYHLSRRKTRRLLHELFGISLSLGALSRMKRRANPALKSAHEEALGEVQHAGVKHSDVTSWTRSGKLMSLWVVATIAAPVYQIFGCWFGSPNCGTGDPTSIGNGIVGQNSDTLDDTVVDWAFLSRFSRP